MKVRGSFRSLGGHLSQGVRGRQKAAWSISTRRLFLLPRNCSSRAGIVALCRAPAALISLDTKSSDSANATKPLSFCCVREVDRCVELFCDQRRYCESTVIRQRQATPLLPKKIAAAQRNCGDWCDSEMLFARIAFVRGSAVVLLILSVLKDWSNGVNQRGHTDSDSFSFPEIRVPETACRRGYTGADPLPCRRCTQWRRSGFRPCSRR